MKKRGQMKMSFGMIFSIFLIIIFIAFATYAIIKFINLQQTIQVESFKNTLQEDIDAMWQSQQGSREVEYYLPNKIDKVCFDEENRLSFTSEENFEEETLEHIDVDDFCADNIDGKVSMTLVKDFGETLVRITE